MTARGFFQPALVLAIFACAAIARAQPDYPPALWNPAYSGHWYTSGNSHSFCVIHDMEGYYESVISYFQMSATQASAHYCVNSLQNGNDAAHSHVESNPTDAPAGEITQMVREQYWAWHVLCWNTYMFGTEHEGFVDSPAWYSEPMYQASAGLQRHLCTAYSIPQDRNHIIGHNEWQNSTWTNWMAANWPQIDTTCNNHTDPGQYWNWAHFMQLITNGPPSITTQPLNRSVDPGASVTFTTAASGITPIAYQWYFGGGKISGATGTSYNLASAQSNNIGNYSVVVSNVSGFATSSVAFLMVNPLQTLQVVFSDNFDVNSSANWNLFQGSSDGVSDYTATWAFDYSTNTYTFNGVTQTIPIAPSTTNGTRLGLKLTVNKNDADAAGSAVSLYPKSQGFSGNYMLRFDMWINYNGNSGGGSGSTEFATCGINHTGTRVNWGSTNASASDGLWFTVDGEGGAASDYRAYVGNPGGNPAQLAFASSGLTANGAQTDDATADPFWLALFPSPTYETPGTPGKHWVQGEVSQWNGVITWRMNGVVVAQRTNTSSYTSGNIMLGYMDIFPSIANPKADNYVIFDNVQVLTPAAPPVITNQPASLTVNAGSHATFNVSAGGTAPLAYQWKFNSGAISGATASSLTLSNVQMANAGTYSLIVSNVAGSVVSSNALLTVTQINLAGPAYTNGSLQFTISGAPGPGYTIQTSSNLTNWVTLSTLVNSNGTFLFTDPVNTNNPQLFYRVIAPQ